MRSLIYCMVLLVLTAGMVQAAGTLFVADADDDQMIWAYDTEGNELWQGHGGSGTRHINNLTMGRNNELVWASRGGVENMLVNYDAATGENYDNRYKHGTRIKDTAWGPDYNGDGKSEMYVSGDNKFWVVDVDDSDKANVNYNTLATYDVADSSDGATGTGSNNVFFGPDQNGDGVQDLYASKGWNSNDNWINVWDPLTGNKIDAVDMRDGTYDGTRGAKEMIINPVNSNELWVLDYYRNSVRAVDLTTLENAGKVDLGFNLDNPEDMIVTPDGIVYIATRFATSLSDNDTSGEDPYGNIVKYDPATGDASLWMEKSGKFSALAYVPEPATIALLGFGGMFLARRKKK